MKQNGGRERQTARGSGACFAAVLLAIHSAVALSLLSFGTVDVHAQAYPARPVRLVVPWPPGGSNDLAARILAPKLGQSLGQQVVVDNRAGAGGIIGSDIVAKAVPDGYTIMLNSATHVANATIYPKLPYDTLKGFTAITLVARVPTVMVVHPSLGVSSVRDLISLAKAKPGQINYGSAGSGSQFHMATALFAKMAGIELVHIPYKGGAPAVTALLGGEVQMLTATVPSVIGHLKARKLRALAVTSPQRSLLLPELPTVAESGIPGYAMDSWLGVFAPAGLPPALIKRLHDEIARVQSLPEVAASLSTQGMEPAFSTQTEFAAFVPTELKKYAVIIKEFGARSD